MGENVSILGDHPSVRPYVDTFTMKRNAARNRLVKVVNFEVIRGQGQGHRAPKYVKMADLLRYC